MTSKIPEQVIAVVPFDGDGITHKQIQERVGMWSPATLNRVVYELIATGAVERLGTQQKPLFRRTA